MREHISGECPLTEYSCLKCQQVVLRKDQASHLCEKDQTETIKR